MRLWQSKPIENSKLFCEIWPAWHFIIRPLTLRNITVTRRARTKEKNRIKTFSWSSDLPQQNRTSNASIIHIMRMCESVALCHAHFSFARALFESIRTPTKKLLKLQYCIYAKGHGQFSHYQLILFPWLTINKEIPDEYSFVFSSIRLRWTTESVRGGEREKTLEMRVRTRV